jgi:hypothetical protein
MEQSLQRKDSKDESSIYPRQNSFIPCINDNEQINFQSRVHTFAIFTQT